MSRIKAPTMPRTSRRNLENGGPASRTRAVVSAESAVVGVGMDESEMQIAHISMPQMDCADFASPPAGRSLMMS